MLSRDGCCADWPKPCGYHEGVQDAQDVMQAEFDLQRKYDIAAKTLHIAVHKIVKLEAVIIDAADRLEVDYRGPEPEGVRIARDLRAAVVPAATAGADDTPVTRCTT